MRAEEYRYIGKSISNDGVYGKVTGSTEYCPDMQSVRMLHLKLKPGTVAHGYVKRIDTSKAWEVPGVRAVYTWENTPDKSFDRGTVGYWEDCPNQEKLFSRHLRFYGERVAAVVAETAEIAEYACRLIEVEYEELPAVISPEEAIQPDAPKIHEEGNYCETEAAWGDYEKARGDCTFQTQVHIGRMTHLCMETQSARACYDKAKKKLTVWCGCQTSYGVRSTVAEFLEMPYSKVRVVKTPMGGSFGSKQEMVVEPLAAYAAKDLQADVMLVYTREEQIVNAMLKHSLDGWVESKVDRDGKIQGISFKCHLESGAYQTISPSYLRTIGGKLGKVYRMNNIRFTGKAICTNTPVNGSFRSWGSCEATMSVESHWNYVAGLLHMDPIDFRLKNILQPDDLEVMHHASVGNVRFKECLLTGRKAFSWDRRRTDCLLKNKGEDVRYRYGVGMALCSHTSSFYPYRTDVASAAARLQDDGSVIVHVPVHDHGCGTVMAMKKIAAEVLQMDIEHIELHEADTENTFYDYGCYASRTTYVLGQAVKLCAEKLLDKCRSLAARMAGCSESVLKYRDGSFVHEAEPQIQFTLKEIWNYALNTVGEDVYVSNTWNSQVNPGTAAAHFTEVKVDTYTGHVDIVECLSVHDIGKAINPDLCRGQVGSGIQQGMGMALCEEIKIDPRTGRTLITNFKDYEVANACGVPEYETIFIEEEEEGGPFGAKGIGEIVVAPIAPAIAAAVNHALGTNLTKLPLSPAVILEALREDGQYGN